MAFTTSCLPCPAFVISTPEDQSSHTFPQRSKTWQPSARSQTTGGCPRIALGSRACNFVKIGNDCGAGNMPAILRKGVSIVDTRRGVMLNSLAMFVFFYAAETG